MSARKCSHHPEQAESLVGRDRAHTGMLTRQERLWDINRTAILREREDIVARVEKASEKSSVGNGAEKACAQDSAWQRA